MAITKCALAVITNRGRDVVPATWSELAADEADFLERHVAELRSHIDEGDARGRFKSDSLLPDVFERAVIANRDDFVAIANELVTSLAREMQSVRSSSCVLAFVVEVLPGAQDQVTLLKLDAEVEAARLEEIVGGGIRLQVFDDLLPSPGDIQKGFSFPDPRSPESDVVLLDKVTPGTATKYFQRAFGVTASPASKEVENALRRDLASLRGDDFDAAVDAIGRGGPVGDVVTRIREVVPHFTTSATHPTQEGAPTGYVRENFNSAAPIPYEANGIKLFVPPRHRGSVRTRSEGTGFITEIRTTTPLTPLDDE